MSFGDAKLLNQGEINTGWFYWSITSETNFCWHASFPVLALAELARHLSRTRAEHANQHQHNPGHGGSGPLSTGQPLVFGDFNLRVLP